MKRSKRQENWIIIHFVFYFIITCWLILFIFISIIPQVKEIEAEKDSIRNLYSSIQRVEKNGLLFTEFKGLNSSWNKNTVISEIIKSMDENFYNENLLNNEYTTYEEFLIKMDEELNSEENITKVEEKIEKLSQILPIYSEAGITLWEESLTDYKFINYIESLLKTFNLSYTDPIWINNINILEEYVWGKNNINSLDSNLFYIPLDLTLSWKKEGIMEFLYYVEKVWQIKIYDNTIEIQEELGILNKNNRKIILEWDPYSKTYNIFEHQIIDIDKINMSEYIDSSYLSRWEADFKEFIIEDQWEDLFQISVSLLFYTKWQPIYKIEDFINSVLDKHTECINLAANILKDTTIDDIEYQNVIKYNKALTQLTKTVAAMRASITKGDNLEALYSKALTLDEQLEPIFIELKE